MTEQPIMPQNQGNEENSFEAITLHDIIEIFFTNWRWFVASVVLCLGVAYFYLASTPSIYKREAMLLIKDSRKGGDLEITAFSDLAGFQSRRNVDNELYILQSRRLMIEVVKKLNLTTNYATQRGLRQQDLYKQSPIEVSFINDDNKQGRSLVVTPLNDQRVELSNFQDKYLSRREQRMELTAAFGDTISTPVGQLVVAKTLYLDSTYYNKAINVTKSTLEATANSYRKRVQSGIVNKQASVVSISMNAASPRRAEDVINTLIEVYNEDGIKDKQSISQITAEFIASRLEVIGMELGKVDHDIASIKQSNRIIDIQSEATRTAGESSRYKAESLSLENQITTADYIRTYLQDASKAHDLIPMVASIANSGISNQIDDYNTAILQRQKLLQNSSENSPVIQQLNTMLAGTRNSIIASLSSHIETLEMQLKTMRQEENRVNSRISSMPTQEKVMLDVARQQKIKEELYLYLLNKQEETQLNYVIAEPNARIIDIQSEATRTAGESSRYKAESLSLENQITTADYIRTYLQDASKAHDLIPMVASIA
ncbi:MAG: chromosome partitioning protein ParA, partial [Alistipes sp.]|nr:chromosome partitioning protein ParA [Alistipes sp.]